MARFTTEFDGSNPHSLESHARQLEGHTLREWVRDVVRESPPEYGGRGGFGQLVEELVFRQRPHSDSRPDFPEAGVELKTTPLKKTRSGLRAKERMVLGIIDYMTVVGESDFYKSSFWAKNARLLMMLYLWVEQAHMLDYRFKHVGIWQYPEEDLKIIIDDWNRIVGKIRRGEAHLLSEKDTTYLAACTKGANSSSKRPQPKGPKAMQRAYSLKAAYVTSIYDSRVDKSDSIVKHLDDYAEAETFEDLVIRKLSGYYGKSEGWLKKHFNLSYSKQSKHRYYLLAKAMLGVEGKRIAEFDKADIPIKTIRIEKNGRIKEHMSFRQISFNRLLSEEWEDSQFHEEIDRRFLFMVFGKNEAGELIFTRAMFWSVPDVDMEVIKEVWEDTKRKVVSDDYGNFIKASDGRIAHVRTKGRDSRDLTGTPSGRFITKRCFWLNKDYILSQLK